MMLDSVVNARRVYVDSNIWIALTEGHKDENAVLRGVVEFWKASNTEFYTSDLVWTECFTKPVELKNEALIEHYTALFSDANRVTLVPVTPDLLGQAAQICATTSLKTLDSIHAASAKLSECDLILTNDKKFKSLSYVNVCRPSDFLG